MELAEGLLSLRCFERSDLPAFLDLWGSAPVMRYVEDGSTVDAAAAQRELDRLIRGCPPVPFLGRRARLHTGVCVLRGLDAAGAQETAEDPARTTSHPRRVPLTP